MLHVAHQLITTANKYPDRLAVVSVRNALTYRELDLQSSCLANALKRRGITKGKRVAMLLHNSCEWAVTFYALQKLGAVAVPLHVRLHGSELAEEVRLANCKALVFGASLTDLAEELLRFYPECEFTICVGDSCPIWAIPWENMFLDPDYSFSMEGLSNKDLSVILFTSGTTGAAKGVTRTQKMMALHAVTLGVTNCSNLDHDIMLSAASLYHAGGSQGLIKMVFLGGTYITLPRIVPEDVLSMIETYRVTQLQMLPPVTYERLYLSGIWKNYDCSSVHEVCISAGKCTVEYADHVFEMFPNAHLRPSWGSTETCSVTCMHLTRQELAACSGQINNVGQLIPLNEVRLVDDDGNLVPPGSPGEARVRSPMLFSGYLLQGNVVDPIFDEKGWFHTGDIMRQDPKTKCFYFIDRKKDMIKSGGENIFAMEIEQVIQQHPAILECAVVGVPDEEFDEAIGAAIVLNPGMTLTPQELVDFCKQHLPSFKKPRYMAILDQLPVNSVGKVQKGVLRKNAKELFRPIDSRALEQRTAV